MDIRNVRINITKDLAKELGFIETVHIKNTQHSLKSSGKSSDSTVQEFDYLIIIDFESTCWEDRNEAWKQPEIIEFPAVLLNARTGVIEEEFQQYVMPIENKLLSEFCIKFTGIKQEQVENGVPLGTCLLLFTKWITKISEERSLVFHNKQPGKHCCTFVTWSDWDLAMCLHNECQRKNIRKPDILCQWIDLKATYKEFYKRRPKGLRGALLEVGLHFKGREHSGLCDAKNTANLAWRMTQHGAILKITKVLLQVKKPCISTKTSIPKTIKDHFRVSKNTLKKTTSLNVSKTQKTEIVEITVRQPLREINTPVTTRRKINEIIQSPPSRDSTVKRSSSNHWNSEGRTNITLNRPRDSLQEEKPSNLKMKQAFNPKICNLQNMSVGYKTPETSRSFLSTSCKRTPPLCSCGRRAMRRFATLPGPNQGRSFYTCSKRKSLGMVHSTGCNFFKWEH